jgi:hypothetical protein
MTNTISSNRTRLPFAIALIVAAFFSTVIIATYSNKGSNYWVATQTISPGRTISPADITLVHANLTSVAESYVPESVNPVGMVATQSIQAAEIITTSDLISAGKSMSTSAVPLSVRGVDLATDLQIGEGVDIYWVLDTQNGDGAIDPILILGGVTLLSYDKGGNNFGSDIGITVAVEETQVLRLLSATTQGRLVVVRTHV